VRRADFLHDALQRSFQLTGLRVKRRQPVEHPAFERQSGLIRLLVAGPLPRPQVARCQQQQRQIARPQRLDRGVVFHGDS
jgi:hypothetical protein